MKNIVIKYGNAFGKGAFIGGIILLFILSLNYWVDSIILYYSFVVLMPVFLGIIFFTYEKQQLEYSFEKTSIIDAFQKEIAYLKSKVNDQNNDLEKAESQSYKVLKSKKEAERKIDKNHHFLSILNHNIRTSMNNISGFVQLISQSHLDQKQKKYIESIKYASQSILININDVYQISNLHAGKIDFEQNPIQIQNLVYNVLNTVMIHSKSSDFIFDVYFAENVPDVILGDATRLKQIFLYILSHTQLSHSQGRLLLKISSREISNEHINLTFSIIDYNRVLSSDELEYVFDINNNYKTNNYDTKNIWSLAISRSLIELQGGQMKIASDVDTGTNFSFEIPFGIAHNTDSEDDLYRPEKFIQDFGSIKILLVEDSQSDSVSAKKILRKWNKQIEIDTAGNGLDAVESLIHKDYDIILMNLNLPQMDGFDTTRYIRQVLESPKQDIPIIALTSEILSSEKSKAFEAGMNEYITKPFNLEELFFKIGKQIGASLPV